MNPMEDIIWDLTKDIENSIQFKSTVNFLFRNDPHSGSKASYHVDLAIRRIANRSSESQGYEYILELNQEISKIINNQF